MSDSPNLLFVMTDQQRADTIGPGNGPATPTIDSLMAAGVNFANAYSTGPECIPARYALRTGTEPIATGILGNQSRRAIRGVRPRIGPFLGQVMRRAGYRTWAVGKSHTRPRTQELGYDVHLRSEEMFHTPQDIEDDAYASWLRNEHPTFDFVESFHGERTSLYYVPQISPLPAELVVESWASDRAIELIAQEPDPRPWFGFVSYIGPHPPFAPPPPFHRRYDPDDMPAAIVGPPTVDLADDALGYVNYRMWAEDISDPMQRKLRAHYFGEISFIDQCAARLVEAANDPANGRPTVIVFVSDHGELLGDHGAWQKSSFFESSTRIPFIIVDPESRYGAAGSSRRDLVSLTDLFGLATEIAGKAEYRGGRDLRSDAPARDSLVGTFGEPGSGFFKAMLRWDRFKYLYFENGARELLFDLEADPNECVDLAGADPGQAEAAKGILARQLKPHLNQLPVRDFEPFERQRIYQFNKVSGAGEFG